MVIRQVKVTWNYRVAFAVNWISRQPDYPQSYKNADGGMAPKLWIIPGPRTLVIWGLRGLAVVPRIPFWFVNAGSGDGTPSII